MLFDFKFDWDDSLNVGIPEIDTQHQEFFRIGRSIEQLILTGCKNITEKELLELLCEIRQYVTYHFYTEEEMLRERQEVLEKHKVKHEFLKKKINAVDCNKLVEEPVEALKELKNVLQEWFFEHMLMEDIPTFRTK